MASASIASWDEASVRRFPRVDANQGIATENQREVDPAWDRCLNALIGVWGFQEDDGLTTPPTQNAVESACRWLVYLKRLGYAPPALINYEPTGGIILAFHDRASDGSDRIIEFTFYNNRLAERTLYRNGRILYIDNMPTDPPPLPDRLD